jgi:hypothetical protein
MKFLPVARNLHKALELQPEILTPSSAAYEGKEPTVRPQLRSQLSTQPEEKPAISCQLEVDTQHRGTAWDKTTKPGALMSYLTPGYLRPPEVGLSIIAQFVPFPVNFGFCLLVPMGPGEGW